MLQLNSQLAADADEVSLYLPRASQSRLNMRQYILSSHPLQKVGLRDEPRRLIPRAAEQKSFAGFMETIGRAVRAE
jgi:hypothetical protein